MRNLRSVVLPVAGMGTRMLPATKAVPKELLPIYDTPLLQFALDEALNAGAERIVVVSHRSKTAIEEYMRTDERLKASLRRKGKNDILATLERTEMPSEVSIKIVYQDEARGLGHAIACARDHVLDGPFGVILPDDLLVGGQTMSQMTDAYDPERCNSLIAAMEVDIEETKKYGVFRITKQVGHCYETDGMVEKPDPADAPSTFAAVGRYILSPDIFDAIERTDPGAGGEIQLTDAIDSLKRVQAMPLREQRFDCGSKEGYFAASMAMREQLQRASAAMQLAAE